MCSNHTDHHMAVWCAPKLLKKPKCGSQNETIKINKNLGTFFNLQHFKGKRVCWSFGMWLRWTHKQEFKMKSIYKKKRRWLMQVERKWCGELSRENLKHKFYIARNLFKKNHHSPPYSKLYDFPWELHPNGIFFPGLPNGSPKIRTIIVPKFSTLISSSNQFFVACKGTML
jgi:hypothetical protein